MPSLNQVFLCILKLMDSIQVLKQSKLGSSCQIINYFMEWNDYLSPYSTTFLPLDDSLFILEKEFFTYLKFRNTHTQNLSPTSLLPRLGTILDLSKPGTQSTIQASHMGGRGQALGDISQAHQKGTVCQLEEQGLKRNGGDTGHGLTSDTTIPAPVEKGSFQIQIRRTCHHLSSFTNDT